VAASLFESISICADGLFFHISIFAAISFHIIFADSFNIAEV
jgi:hypothetical protein